jgi:hypothetical protein
MGVGYERARGRLSLGASTSDKDLDQAADALLAGILAYSDPPLSRQQNVGSNDDGFAFSQEFGRPGERP